MSIFNCMNNSKIREEGYIAGERDMSLKILEKAKEWNKKSSKKIPIQVLVDIIEEVGKDDNIA